MLKKKHSSKLVGGADTGSLEERICGKAVTGGPGQAKQWLEEQAVPNLCGINREEHLGNETAA